MSVESVNRDTANLSYCSKFSGFRYSFLLCDTPQDLNKATARLLELG